MKGPACALALLLTTVPARADDVDLDEGQPRADPFVSPQAPPAPIPANPALRALGWVGVGLGAATITGGLAVGFTKLLVDGAGSGVCTSVNIVVHGKACSSPDETGTTAAMLIAAGAGLVMLTLGIVAVTVGGHKV